MLSELGLRVDSAIYTSIAVGDKKGRLKKRFFHKSAYNFSAMRPIFNNLKSRADLAIYRTYFNTDNMYIANLTF